MWGSKVNMSLTGFCGVTFSIFSELSINSVFTSMCLFWIITCTYILIYFESLYSNFCDIDSSLPVLTGFDSQSTGTSKPLEDKLFLQIGSGFTMSFTFGNSYSGFLRINKRRRSKLARIAKLTTYKKKEKKKTERKVLGSLGANAPTQNFSTQH